MKRATFIPASINPSSVGISQQAGPNVHTIFVLRLDTSDAEVIDDRVMLEPRSSGPEADV